ncbi:uncharacterized protein GGS25DRAFT_519591 [Hypoxylon fragiforme]|uniref:uncharacterized protein n=1 Tax=Hypoxylon fragiforme TaxID=63214 RepID=UPI0020C65DE2|nr:uncharacterized protein GGS25DRAFT_519591 [Hypoxylon fragiforme]KAI2611288.1 hypothetical protein GGS25DRAFT_519591 [Hypoxylon fragiforme]
MATNNQADGSTGAVQYLNHHQAPEIAQRPNLDVPVNVDYNMQRFLNPHLHADDRTLRPPPQYSPSPSSPTPLTEDESRSRMTAILGPIMLNLAPKQN